MAINLDNILRETTKEIATQKPQPTIKIDIDDILLEWSYRLPKGYPTIKDGRFVDPKELDVLYAILEEKNIPTIDLTEARVFHHPDWAYVPNDAYASQFADLGFDIEELNSKPFNHTDDRPTQGRFILVKGTSKVREITPEEAQTVMQQDKTVVLQSDAYEGVYIIAQGDVNGLTQAKDDTATDTNVKEGLVMLFYHADIVSMPTEETFGEVVAELVKVLDSMPETSLDSLTSTKLTNFLKVITNVKPKKGAKILTDFWSSAANIKSGYKADQYPSVRTGLFDRIRSLASKFTGLWADKWCPGDIYLINTAKVGAIEERLSQLEKDMPEDGIGLINGMFIDVWGSNGERPDQGIVAISLKAEKAQAGKAKQYLQLLTRQDLTYNVAKEEFDLDIQAIADRVTEYREMIKKLVQQANINIELDQDSNAASIDEKRLREKFASLKLTYYLLGERGEEIDDNLLGAVAFGMSLSGVNPTFWKVIGSTKGDAKRIENPAKSTLSLLDGGLDSMESTITIRDKDSNNNIKFEMKVRKGEEDHFVILNARSNGGKQATLEIVKDQPL